MAKCSRCIFIWPFHALVLPAVGLQLHHLTWIPVTLQLSWYQSLGYLSNSAVTEFQSNQRVTLHYYNKLIQFWNVVVSVVSPLIIATRTEFTQHLLKVDYVISWSGNELVDSMIRNETWGQERGQEASLNWLQVVTDGTRLAFRIVAA